MLGVTTARQSNTSDDAGWCLWSFAVLPVTGGSEAVRHRSAAVADGPSSAHGGTSTDFPRARGSHHAAVQARTQLLCEQVHVPAEQPRLQPSHVQVSNLFATRVRKR